MPRLVTFLTDSCSYKTEVQKKCLRSVNLDSKFLETTWNYKTLSMMNITSLKTDLGLVDLNKPFKLISGEILRSELLVWLYFRIPIQSTNSTNLSIIALYLDSTRE